MKPLNLFCLLSILSSQLVTAQAFENKSSKKKLEFFSLALTNSHTAMPFGRFSSLLYKEMHPGAEIGTGFTWSKKKKHAWTQSLKAAYSYHGYVQHSFMLYTEGGYSCKVFKDFIGNARIGAGYLLSKEDSKVFTLNNEGEYTESNKFGRSHAMASFSIGISKP